MRAHARHPACLEARHARGPFSYPAVCLYACGTSTPLASRTTRLEARRACHPKKARMRHTEPHRVRVCGAVGTTAYGRHRTGPRALLQMRARAPIGAPHPFAAVHSTHTTRCTITRCSCMRHAIHLAVRAPLGPPHPSAAGACACTTRRTTPVRRLCTTRTPLDSPHPAAAERSMCTTQAHHPLVACAQRARHAAHHTPPQPHAAEVACAADDPHVQRSAVEGVARAAAGCVHTPTH